MGGECFRYCELRRGAEATEEEKEIYKEVLSEIMEVVNAWFSEQDPKEWVVAFDKENALELQVKDQDLFKKKIVLPKELNESLKVGWQHRHYGSNLDPKFDIAEKIMNILFSSKLKRLLDENEEDEIANDLYGFREDHYEEERYQKGPYHYSSGIPDSSWSPNGMYAGYDDYEDYLDAYGIDVSND